MFKFNLLIALLLLSLTSITCDPIFAADKTSQDSKLISSQEAVKLAKQKTGGKVLGVKLHKMGGKSVYKVRILTDKKHVKNISINANRKK